MFSGWPISATALHSSAPGFLPVERSTQARLHAEHVQDADWRGIGSLGFHWSAGSSDSRSASTVGRSPTQRFCSICLSTSVSSACWLSSWFRSSSRDIRRVQRQGALQAGVDGIQERLDAGRRAHPLAVQRGGQRLGQQRLLLLQLGDARVLLVGARDLGHALSYVSGPTLWSGPVVVTLLGAETPVTTA